MNDINRQSPVSRKGYAAKISRTAMFIAILVAVQFVTKALGQLVTGSGVNLVLALCSLTCGIWSAVIVSVISPFLAFLLGIGTPVFPIVPFIAVGNIVYSVLTGILIPRQSGSVQRILSVILSALAKFLVLYLTIRFVALPMVGLPEAKAAVILTAFSWPQLFTAVIGGMLALEIYKRFKFLKPVQ